MSEVAEKKERKRGEFRRISRCTHVMEDGRKCRQRPWLGGELCFQHDPEAEELRKLAGRPRSRAAATAQQVQELLGETLEELRAGRMKPGHAYAVGYVAQLMLAAQEARRKEVKLDVKWFWDMVDLLLALEDGKKALKEKKAKEARATKEEETEKTSDEGDDGQEDEGGDALVSPANLRYDARSS